MKNKKGIIILCILAVLAIGTTVVVQVYNNRKMKSQKCDEKLESVIDQKQNYIVVDVKKDDFTNISSREFINLTQPTVDQGKNKQYVTFAFEDGTGICFSSANIYYGDLNDDGTVKTVIGRIEIKDSRVTYQEVDNNEINGSVVLRNLMDESYVSEDTDLYYKEGIFHIYVSPQNKTDSEIVADFCNYFKKSGLTYDSVHLVINGKSAYEIDKNYEAHESILSNGF